MFSVVATHILFLLYCLSTGIGMSRVTNVCPCNRSSGWSTLVPCHIDMFVSLYRNWNGVRSRFANVGPTIDPAGGTHWFPAILTCLVYIFCFFYRNWNGAWSRVHNVSPSNRSSGRSTLIYCHIYIIILFIFLFSIGTGMVLGVRLTMLGPAIDHVLLY